MFTITRVARIDNELDMMYCYNGRCWVYALLPFTLADTRITLEELAQEALFIEVPAGRNVWRCKSALVYGYLHSDRTREQEQKRNRSKLFAAPIIQACTLDSGSELIGWKRPSNFKVGVSSHGHKGKESYK